MKSSQSFPKQIVITGVEDDEVENRYFGFIVDLVRQMVHLFQYRELIRNLVIRDLKVRYKNSILGVLWSLMNPLLMMIVFTVVFTIMAPIRAASVNSFPVFVLCGLLPWNFFVASIMGSTVSIIGNAALLKKVYFPREVIPISLVLSNLVNFLIALILLFAFIFFFQIQLTIWALFLPLIIFIQIIFTLGIGFFLATANVFYRDTHQIMDVLALAWFFVTPVIYPISILPEQYELTSLGITLDVQRLAYILNPMASLIANYRVILVDGSPPALDFLGRTMLTAGVVFILGWSVFYRYSWRFAEEL